MLLGYLISSIPASWSPMCFATKTDAVIVCPNMSLPSIPFVEPKLDVISMWTMSQSLATLSIHLAVSNLFDVENSLINIVFFSTSLGSRLYSAHLPLLVRRIRPQEFSIFITQHSKRPCSPHVHAPSIRIPTGYTSHTKRFAALYATSTAIYWCRH